MILVCAATGTEAAACRRGIADAEAPGIEVLTTGVGPERAARALGRWLEARPHGAGPPSDRRPALVVSAGFAGALTPDVAPMAWVTAASVHRLVGGRAVPSGLPRELLRVADGAQPCHFVSADHVVAGGVPGLAAPAAADMESAALADVAGAAGIPFAVLRLVTDTPTHPLAPVAHCLAGALAAHGVRRRAAHAARAALAAARSPAGALAFLRESMSWTDRLRAGWREHASRGVPASPEG
ncbi:MAG TPA: hypothetical protein VF904_18310 [Anaeromyxobacteraceae bacterium]